MSYAILLGYRMNYMTEEDKIEDLLYAPYAYDDFDKEDLIKRLNLMVPENMSVIYQSKLV
jgi:secreted Zn-dependent insulinase-like peptidase